jgi:hypothetical protein
MTKTIKKCYNVYKTTNLVNGKFYWGVHDSTDENDGYLGSGTVLRKAIKKYSEDSFKRKTMVIYETAGAAYFDERLIVNQEMVDDEMCYNNRIGGKGGWEHIDNKGNKNPMFGRIGEDSPNYGSKRSEETKKKMRKPKSEKTKLKMSIAKTGKTGKTKGKRRFDQSIRMRGQNNPMSKSNREKCDVCDS